MCLKPSFTVFKSFNVDSMKTYYISVGKNISGGAESNCKWCRECLSQVWHVSGLLSLVFPQCLASGNSFTMAADWLTQKIMAW